jgi:RHS repeat-associated protein
LLVKTGSTVNFANYFDYTSRNELLNIYDNSHAAFFKYSYDANGNVTQRLGQRLHDSTVLTYDALNRPITCAQNGLNGANFATSHYAYGMLGNLANTTRDEEAGKGDYFTYDHLNQTTSALYSAMGASDPNPAKQVTYTLGIRNRNSMTVTDNILHTTTTTSYDNNTNSLNQLTSITVNGVAQSVGWESNLNLGSYNGWAYTYDAENRLSSVAGNGHSATFRYDAVGRCVKRVIDGVTTILTYDQWTPIAEWDGSGNLTATNVYGLGDDEIVYRSAGSTQLFYKSDPMGNVKFILDQSGTGIEKYTYDAFGSPSITDWSGHTNSTSAYGNRFMFSGRDYMISLALYDMRNRVYDPMMGRFYQTDPISFQGDPLNFYRFCGNNPLLGGDSMGLDFWSDVVGVFEFVSTIFTNLSVYGSSDGAGTSSGYDPYYNPLGLDTGSQLGPLSGPLPWGYLGASGGSFFELSWSQPMFLASSSTASNTKQAGKSPAPGTFTILFTNTRWTSGTDVDITYACPTCKNLKLIQYVRGYLPKDLGGYKAWYVRDKELSQNLAAPGLVHATDQAGRWEYRSMPGSATTVQRDSAVPFPSFWQEMETVAICKDNGQDTVLGAWFWGHTFTGEGPKGGAFRYNNGTWKAYLPTRSGIK